MFIAEKKIFHNFLTRYLSLRELGHESPVNIHNGGAKEKWFSNKCFNFLPSISASIRLSALCWSDMCTFILNTLLNLQVFINNITNLMNKDRTRYHNVLGFPLTPTPRLHHSTAPRLLKYKSNGDWKIAKIL